MKRKFFSKLLMGALLVASVSSVVSCKDYDDDINNLQAQIDKRATITQLEEMQSKLSASIQAAQATADTALAKANAAATKEELKSAIDEVNRKAEEAAKKVAEEIQAVADSAAEAKAAANKAQESADKAQASADKAQEAADKANEAAAKAQSTADTATELAKKAQEAVDKIEIPDVSGFQNEEQVKKLISEYAQAKGEYVLASELKEQLDKIKEQIENLTNSEEFEKIKNKIELLNTMINELYTAVTSIDLVDSYSGSRHTLQGGFLGYYGKSVNVIMTHGLISETSVFGDKEDGSHTISPLANYKEGDDIKDPKGIIVRVNPVNADISAAKISLINSKGESLEGFVEIGTPKRFDKLITRATSIETGLWELPLEVAPGVSEDDFNKKVKTSDGDTILYAVAINNTLKDAANASRYVVSSYDLSVGYQAYKPANHFTFTVKNSVAVTSVEKIHNRWDATNGYIKGESSSNTSKSNPEKAWITPTPSISAPVAVPNKDNQQDDKVVDGAVWTLPASVGFNEDRHDQALFIVSEDKPFTITKLTAYQSNGEETVPDSFYVALDYKNAIESATSEVNAWETYKIDGLNTMTAADQDLSLTIKSGYNAYSDIIGFRVWAVNRDGSLVDPDGRAFYVLVTDAATTDALSATVTASKSGNTISSTEMDITGKLNGTYTYKMKLAKTPKIVSSATTAVDADLKYFAFNFLKNKSVAKTVNTLSGQEATIDVQADATAMTITPQNMENLVDGATYVFTMTGYESVGGTDVPRTITTITLQKTMPTTAKSLQFLPDKEVIDGSGKFNVYLVPNKGNTWASPWATNFADEDANVYKTTEGSYVDNGFMDLNNIFYNVNDDKTLQFVFKASLRNSANTADVDLINSATNSGIIYDSPGSDPKHYMLDVASRYINGSTEHTVEVYTIYNDVSTTLKSNGTVDKFAQKYLVKSSQELTAIYRCWHHASSFDWTYVNKVYKQPKIKWTVGGSPQTVSLSDITNTSSYYNSTFGKDLKTLISLTYLILPSTVSIQLNTKTDGSGLKNPYFKPTINSSEITFTQTSAAPTADGTEYLIFTLKDVYGHDVTLSLPVIIQCP